MSKIIGVEQSLSHVEDALKAKGYEVIQLRKEEDAHKCDCCVITGQDTDMMGISDTALAGPVIEASGLSADEITQRVDRHFH